MRTFEVWVTVHGSKVYWLYIVATPCFSFRGGALKLPHPGRPPGLGHRIDFFTRSEALLLESPIVIVIFLKWLLYRSCQRGAWSVRILSSGKVRRDETSEDVYNIFHCLFAPRLRYRWVGE